jgi:dolichol-phosphate mannosyltransferase
MKDVSIILPTYNESGNIKPLIESIIKYISDLPYEIIVVDDDSKDGTGEIASRIASSNPNVRIFVRKEEKGLASAIRYGIGKSNGLAVVVMDTDFNHPPFMIPALVNGLKNYDMVIGSRYISGGGMSSSRLQFELSRILNIYIKMILGTGVNDNTCGFFAVKKDLLSKLPAGKIFVGYGDYFFRLLYHMKGYKIREVPVVYGVRMSGQTKTNILKMGQQYGIGALKTRFKK